MDEEEDLQAEIAELTRQLDESPSAGQEDAVEEELNRLRERLRELVRARNASDKKGSEA